MKKHSAKIILLFLGLLLLPISFIKAQNQTLTSGGDISSPSGTINYSIGQIFYTTNGATSGTVSQGVQQAYEIFVTTGIEHIEITLNILVYPNPTTDYLLLKIDQEELEGLHFQLYNINGQLLQKNKLNNQETHINISNYSQATYILNVYSNKKEIKTFKIIKH